MINPSIKEEFRLWAEKHLRPSTLAQDRAGTPRKEVWSQIAETRLFHFLPSQKMGGLGRELKDISSAFYGLAQGSLDLPLCSSLAAHAAIGTDLLRHFASPEQIDTYLPAVLSGETVISICNSEATGGTDLRRAKAKFIYETESTGRLVANKSCSTNASIAELLMISALMEKSQTLGVFLVKGSEVRRSDLSSEMMGFKTGWTGSVEVDTTLKVSDRLLGAEDSGPAILKRCFNWERLVMTCMICGLLEGLESELRHFFQSKEKEHAGFLKNQYIQEKAVRLSTVRYQLQALINQVLSSGDESLASQEQGLGILKMMMIDDAFDAAMAVFDVMGYRSYQTTEFPQKIARDLMGVRFFGGTRELQKINLFNHFLKAAAAAPALKLVA